jgi:hypothetical protein
MTIRALCKDGDTRRQSVRRAYRGELPLVGGPGEGPVAVAVGDLERRAQLRHQQARRGLVPLGDGQRGQGRGPRPSPSTASMGTS